MRLEQPPIRIPPNLRPINIQPLLRQQLLYHRDVDVVQVDFVVADPALVGVPVVPEVPDDAGTQQVRGFEELGGGWVDDCAVGEGDGAGLGEAGGESGPDRS